MNGESPLRVGDVLEAFCGGAFGDSYDDLRVEAIGADWVVAREAEGAEGRPVFAAVDPEQLVRYRR